VGVTLARIQVQPSQSILQVPGEDAVVAPTADELFTQVFTEPVPIQAMRDWMQGRLSQSLQAFQIKRDSEMRVTSFRAAQWFVTLSRYDDQGPTLMTMTQKTNQRAVTLKLIVDAQP
jgi:outer membrane biogenesis lipoprotein LolB